MSESDLLQTVLLIKSKNIICLINSDHLSIGCPNLQLNQIGGITPERKKWSSQ